MNLLYTITSYPPSTGGAQTLAHNLAQQMQMAQNHHMQVVSHWDESRTDWLTGTTLRAPSQPHDYVVDGIAVHRMGFGVLERLQMGVWYLPYYPLMPLALPRLANVIERHIAPFAHTAHLIHNTRIGREGISYASFQLARKHDIPFIFTPVHHPRWVGWRYKAFIWLYQHADALITLTTTEKKTLIGLGAREDRVFVSGMGPTLAPTADPAAFRTHYGVKGPMVLFLGQHYDYKGYRQVLSATKNVWQRVPDAEFVFIGPQHNDSAKVLAAHADARLHALGKVDLQTKTSALAACDVLCVPSTQESFGGIYTEAWHFAKPVIGCNIPAVAEVIADGEDGCLVQQHPDEIADRLCHLLTNPGLAQRMGAQGYTKTQAQFTWQRIAERTQLAYNHTLGLA